MIEPILKVTDRKALLVQVLEYLAKARLLNPISVYDRPIGAMITCRKHALECKIFLVPEGTVMMDYHNSTDLSRKLSGQEVDAVACFYSPSRNKLYEMDHFQFNVPEDKIEYMVNRQYTITSDIRRTIPVVNW